MGIRIYRVSGRTALTVSVGLVDLIVSSEISPAELAKLVKRCRPKTLESGFGPILSPQAAVSVLWDMTDARDTSLPIIEFAERLARQGRRSAIRRQLMQWIDGVTDGALLPRPIDHQHIERMRNRLDSQAAQSSHLLVEVIPSATRRSRSAVPR